MRVLKNLITKVFLGTNIFSSFPFPKYVTSLSSNVNRKLGIDGSGLKQSLLFSSR